MAMAARYEILANYHQFYLRDHGTSPDAPVAYDAVDVARRLKSAPGILVLMPERDMRVPVTLECLEEAPPPDLEAWDHVVEASLDLPSGRLEILECVGDAVDVLTLAPGPYRVRFHCGGLGTLSPDRLDGEDHYRVLLWPATPAGEVVLKAYEAPAG